MDASKLKPNDSRVKHETVQIRGKTYSYMIGEPQGTPVDTMLLIHGFPDIGFGWRNQIPHFMSLGFRVIVPDMVGYAGTDAPQDLGAYSLKSISTDMKELVSKYVGDDGQIVLGGHDWGGFLVWRMVLWYPELIKGVFSVCTPYRAPSKQYVPLESAIAAGRFTHFAYQLQLAGPEVEEKIQGEEKIRQFLNGMYGGAGANGKAAFEVTSGVLFDNLSSLSHTKMLSKEELDYYVEQYMRRDAPQMRGPLNWYRTRKLNFDEELPLAEKGVKVEKPALFILATKDNALPRSLSEGMDKEFANLTTREVESSHWALWQVPDAVNQQITEWLKDISGGMKSNL